MNNAPFLRSGIERVTRRQPCQICGKGDFCGRSKDGALALCMRTSDGAIKQAPNGAWVHRLAGDPFKAFTAAPTPAVSVSKRATDQHVDGIYSALIRKHLTLSDAHREALRARGLDDAAIDRHGYKTSPNAGEAREIARSLAGYGLAGVPGFYEIRGEWRLVDFGPGVLIPIRSHDGRIAGLQLRRDKGKYIWISSAKQGGASSGTPVHFSRRDLLPTAKSVVITEGGLKSDIAAHFLNQPVVAGSGVTTFGADFAANLKIICPQLSTVYLAFDMDWTENAHVLGAQTRLLEQLEAQRFDCYIRTWPRAYKGVDDFLAAAANGRLEVAA